MHLKRYVFDFIFDRKANVHAIIQSEDQANEVVNQLETAITELKVIDDWLNHYTHVLDV